ncbi:hypothetical protein CG015_18460 [Vibrio anguillarum]|uniref:DUF6119 family protein n=1 Tax=Vibrio anguillarum TaxID=55601 RepID=UPI000B7BE30B|nr:DUF6119 family protein [Vibrio anguillarum]ASO31119.1 hypothetical protein CG015_18460 [Vibrio anguillarum]
MSNNLEKMTIFRAKDSVKSFSELFDVPTEPLTQFKYISNGYNVECIVKYSLVGGNAKTQVDYPWMVMVNNLSEKINLKFSSVNKTPSAILGLKITKGDSISFFLITFGLHTSRFINNDRLIRDFGIKVAMNICDQNNLRKVNTTTHSSVSTITERQLSQGSSIDIFDINDEKEFFRSISGATYDNYPFIKSFSGKNSIVVNLKKGTMINHDGLIEILLKLDAAYKLEDYRNKFPSYGRLDYVSDTDEIERLDKIVFDMLKNNNFESIHLSPSIVLNDDILHYTYKHPIEKPNAKKFEDINIYDLVSENHKFTRKSSINTVKKWLIYCIGESDELIDMSAYECLNCEIVHGNATYILSSGVWRSVNSDFKVEVDSYIKNNIDNKLNNYLPENISIHCKAQEKGEYKDRYKEEVYNSYVAKNNLDIYLFDKSKIEIADEKRYEICDLLHKDKELIHVKVLKSGSNSLSHLFVQARFYTDAFVKDEMTRKSMRKFIENNDNEENKYKNKMDFLSIISESRSELQETTFSVLLCILTFENNKKIEDLPFMARYELAKTHKYLINERGIKLSYAIRTVNKKN